METKSKNKLRTIYNKLAWRNDEVFKLLRIPAQSKPQQNSLGISQLSIYYICI